jgi:hypothetical protein
MKSIFVFFVIAILLFTSFQVFSSTGSSIGPIELNWKVTAGCSIEKCIDVYNPCECGTFRVEYKILPDGEGIAITTPTSITIKKHETKKVCLTIKTSMLLMPMDYGITITLYRTGNCQSECDLTVQAWHTFRQSYFKVKVSGDEKLNGVYKGWCIDLDSTMKDGRKYKATDISSYEPTKLIEYPENLDLVNYIINKHYVGEKSSCGGRYTYGDVQRAIWTLVDDRQTSAFTGVCNKYRVNKILSEAHANGEGFVPQDGQTIAVILNPCDIKKAQICIIEVPYSTFV